MRKITCATLQTTNVLIHSPAGLENKTIMAKQVDTIPMLEHVCTQLAQLRRDDIKPSLKAEYSAICSAEVPITSQCLFGDDLAKQLRDAKETSKINHCFASSSKNGPFKGKQQISNQHVEKRKKIVNQQQEIMGQLLQIKNRVSAFGSLLPNLVNNFEILCHTFKAGQVAAHFEACINGLSLVRKSSYQFDVLGAATECTAVKHKLPNQIFSEHEYAIVRQEVHKLLKKRVIAKASPIPGQILSNVFLCPKPDGSHRLILNLKRFNESSISESLSF